MIIFPAIDIKKGKVVRLLQGKFDQVTEYAQDPVAMAQHWHREGAQWIHVIDLDGAQTGTPVNSDTIIAIAKAVPIPVQAGGGIRTKDDIALLINGGVQRVVLGTKALIDRVFLNDIVTKWADTIAVSVDCAKGMVTLDGWTKSSQIKALDFINDLKDIGVRCIIYTDIARDGMLNGPNIPALNTLLTKAAVPLIASGGISSIEDIHELATLQKKGLIGAITGKALYEGKFALKEAITAGE